MSVYKNNTETLSQYLQSMVKLEELQKMTEDLDKELEDSQRLMSEIKTIFNTAPNGENKLQLNQELRQDQLTRFLGAVGPRLLMPDMEAAAVVDIETLLVSLKDHAESLKKNIAPQEQQLQRSDRPNVNLNLDQYAASLDVFSKRLTNIKSSAQVTGNNRNTVLEMKLTQLCEDVNNLKQVVETTTKLAKANNNETSNDSDTAASVLCYDNLIVKLVHSINEVSYLIKNCN